MDYSKVAASKKKPFASKNIVHSQTHKKTPEQGRLLKYVTTNSDRGKHPNTPAEEKGVFDSPISYNCNVRNIPNSRRRTINQDVDTIGFTNRPGLLKTEKETDEEKRERLKNELGKFESPFIWKPLHQKPIVQHETAISILEAKDEEIVDERKFKWRNFILQLVVSYELYQANQVDKSLEKINSLEKTLSEQTENREWTFHGIKDALWHVVETSKTFILLESNLDEAEKLICLISPMRFMTRFNQAGIHGIRAAVFMEYGHMGNVRALQEAMEAVKMDRTFAEWFFLVGKCMGRIRRVSQCHEEVSPEEMRAFNTAHRLDNRNPLYLLYLAQAIREKTFRKWKQNAPINIKKWNLGHEDYKKLEKTYFAAKMMYMKALDLRPNCPHLLMRCAYGMMKMSYYQMDLKFARECIDKAIELAPNNLMVHHIKGLYHERFGTEVDEAIQEIKLAADLNNFGAAMDLVRIHHRLNKNNEYNIIEELDGVVAKFGESCVKQVAYAQAGSYLLFIKFEFIEALKYFNKVIELDPQSYAMKSHKSLFLRMKDPVNLFDVLLEELCSNTKWESFSMEDRDVLKIFRISARDHDKADRKEKRLTVQDLLEMSKNQLDMFEKKLQNKKIMGRMRRRQKYTDKVRSKEWRGKMKKKDNGKSTKKVNDKLTDETVRNSRKEDHGFDSISKDKTRISMYREHRFRSSSISSVDSDYHRDSTVHGEREFFVHNDNTNIVNLPNPVRHTFTKNQNRFTQADSEYLRPVFHSQSNLSQSSNSRDSSVCSNYSDKSVNDFENQRAVRNSRYSESYRGTNEESKLTENNMKTFNTSYQWSRVHSSKYGSNDSIASSQSTSSLSVMDRVKQSFAMLDYKNKRSESLQSLNNPQQNKSKKGKNKKPVQRSDSTQSLNIEINPCKNLDFKQKPAFGSRDSSMGSVRSCSFMPYFTKKDLSSESENQCSRDTSVVSDCSSSFMSKFASNNPDIEVEKQSLSEVRSAKSCSFMSSFANAGSKRELENPSSRNSSVESAQCSSLCASKDSGAEPKEESSRDSNVGSAHLSSCMPNIETNSPGIEAEKQSLSDSNVGNVQSSLLLSSSVKKVSTTESEKPNTKVPNVGRARSLSFMPSFAKESQFEKKGN